MFIIILTLLQGTGGNFHFRGVLIIPGFKLEQWAFTAVCVSAFASIVGLAHLVGKYLFSSDLDKLHAGNEVTAASSPTIPATRDDPAPLP